MRISLFRPLRGKPLSSGPSGNKLQASHTRGAARQPASPPALLLKSIHVGTAMKSRGTVCAEARVKSGACMLVGKVRWVRCAYVMASGQGQRQITELQDCRKGSTLEEQFAAVRAKPEGSPQRTWGTQRKLRSKTIKNIAR